MPRPDITLTLIGAQARLSINYLRVATFPAIRLSRWLTANHGQEEPASAELVTGNVTWTGFGEVVIVHHLGHQYRLAPSTVSLLRNLL